MYQDKDANGVYRSFGFKAPAGAVAEKNEVLFPFHDTQEPVYGATLAVTVKQMNTFLKPGVLTGAPTINLTLDSQLSKGAKLHLVLTADANVGGRVVTLGTGFDAAAADITVSASTTFFRTYTFDGTAFIPTYQ
jgi:hypothetical protein